jgi:hypothetical protein
MKPAIQEKNDRNIKKMKQKKTLKKYKTNKKYFGIIIFELDILPENFARIN